MKITAIIVRSLMGALFLFASVAYFFKLMPQPPLTGDVKLFNQALAFYLMPFVKVIELVCGLAFISGRFITLAAVLIFPIIINIVLFHAYLDPKNILIPLLLLLGNLFLAYYYRKNYATLFAAK